MKDFKGRVALITGAAHGFGKEFVKQAAQRGMKIAAVDIMEDALKEIAPLAEELGAEKVLLFPCDVTEYEQVKNVVAKENTMLLRVHPIVRKEKLITN